MHIILEVDSSYSYFSIQASDEIIKWLNSNTAMEYGFYQKKFLTTSFDDVRVKDDTDKKKFTVIREAVRLCEVRGGYYGAFAQTKDVSFRTLLDKLEALGFALVQATRSKASTTCILQGTPRLLGASGHHRSQSTSTVAVDLSGTRSVSGSDDSKA